MKSLVGLLEDVLLDCSTRVGAPVGKDIEVLRRRVEHEGESFITITLPSFCADFERSLAQGRLIPSGFAHFKKRDPRGRPAFLQGFLNQLFDKSGFLVAKPSVDCIKAVRQICLFAKKVLRPCTEARRKDATDAYLRCERELQGLVVPDGVYRSWAQVADIVIGSLGLEDCEALQGAHGPGSVVEPLLGNQKWTFPTWHRRLDDAGFSWFRHAAGGTRVKNGFRWYEDGDMVPKFVDPEHEPPVKVVFVPKTLKSPRVIAVEPLCMQYAQQALKRYLVPRIEGGAITGGKVNFSRQEVNQALALQASQSGKYATLDLSEASDRVHWGLVQRMFYGAPRFLELLEASRSTRATLPTGETITLEKFASMGSALCFPVEALMFFITIIASRVEQSRQPLSRRLVEQLSRDVYVYGDDLIVPADEAPAICGHLEAFGLKVNQRKSFWAGKFRESCGVDAYDGCQVTPVYLRRDVPADRTDASAIVSAVATANQLFDAGLYRAYTSLRMEVERVIGKLPHVCRSSPALGWYGYSESVPPERWNAGLQRVERLYWVPQSPLRDDVIEDGAALAKCLRTAPSSEVDRPRDHLERSVRRFSLTLKRRWGAWSSPSSRD